MDLPHFKNTYFLVDKKSFTQLSSASNSTYHLSNPSIISYRLADSTSSDMQKHDSFKVSNIQILKQYKAAKTNEDSQINLQSLKLKMQN